MINAHKIIELILGSKRKPKPSYRKHFSSGRQAIDSIEGMTTRVVRREAKNANCNTD